MKNFNDTIGNRTRDLPACSAVLQPTEPPRASTSGVMVIINLVQGRKFLHISTEQNLPVWFSVEMGLAHPKAPAQTG